MEDNEQNTQLPTQGVGSPEYGAPGAHDTSVHVECPSVVSGSSAVAVDGQSSKAHQRRVSGTGSAAPTGVSEVDSAGRQSTGGTPLASEASLLPLIPAGNLDHLSVRVNEDDPPPSITDNFEIARQLPDFTQVLPQDSTTLVKPVVANKKKHSHLISSSSEEDIDEKKTSKKKRGTEKTRISKRGIPYLPGETPKQFHLRMTREGIAKANKNRNGDTHHRSRATDRESSHSRTRSRSNLHRPLDSTSSEDERDSVQLPPPAAPTVLPTLTPQPTPTAVATPFMPDAATCLQCSSAIASNVVLNRENQQLRADVTSLRKTVHSQQQQLLNITKELQELRKQQHTLASSQHQPPQRTPPSTVVTPPGTQSPPPADMRAMIKELLVELLGPLGIGPGQKQNNNEQPAPTASPRVTARGGKKKTQPTVTYATTAALPAGNQQQRTSSSTHTSQIATTSTAIPVAPTQPADTPEFPPLTQEWQTVRQRKKRPPPSTRKMSTAPARTPAPKIWGPKRKENTTLIVPTKENTKVLEQIEKSMELDPRQLGVKRKIQFASGALLVTCQDKEAVEKLHSLLPAVPNVTIKAPPAERKHSVRIHAVPAKTTVEQITMDIADRFGDAPSEVIFVPYRNPKIPGSVLAICEVSPEVYKKATTVRNIWIGWRQCRLDSTPYIGRCPRCKLLGHSEKRCPVPENAVDPMEATASPEQPPSACVDCSAYNERLKGMAQSRYRRRPCDHSSGSPNCPTLLKLQRRALPSKPESSGGMDVSSPP